MVQPGGVPKDIAALAAEIVRSCSDDALRRTALELLEGIKPSGRPSAGRIPTLCEWLGLALTPDMKRSE